MPDLDFDMPQNQASSIKVIGVGGGGSNAVNYMYEKGIRGVDFVVCNTDQQALDNSPVPTKIQLGVSITEGLGAGADPLRGKFAAEENIDDVVAVLECNTKMVFINAGMGGGTGTGAAPVIAKTAKEMDILTVAIVTIPFVFEGGLRMTQAKEGIEELKQHVDSLIVINNNKLREIYGNLGFKSGFAKADEILATASRGIAEVITQKGHLNIDLNDAKTVLSNSGTAIMGSGTATGAGRAIKAVKGAIESPLLDNNHIRGAKKVLLLIVSGIEEVTFEEMGEISDFIQDQVMIEGGAPADIIMGVAEDEELESAINVTVVATGFHEGRVVNPVTGNPEVVVHSLDDTQKNLEQNVIEKSIDSVMSEKDVSSLPTERVHILTENEPEDIVQIYNDEDVNIFENKTDNNENIESSKQQVSMTFEFDVEEHVMNEEEIVEVLESESTNERFDLIEEIEKERIEAIKEICEEPSDNVNSVEEPIAQLNQNDIVDEGKIIHTLNIDDEDLLGFDTPVDDGDVHLKEENDLGTSSVIGSKPESKGLLSEQIKDVEVEEQVIKDETNLPLQSESSSNITLSSHSDTAQEQFERAQKRKDRLQKFNYRFRNSTVVNNAESEPAYKRQGVKLNDKVHSEDQMLSRVSLSTNDEGEVELKKQNSFLHDNVD